MVYWHIMALIRIVDNTMPDQDKTTDKIHVIRADELLSREDLRAQLALVLRLENVGEE